MSESRDTTHTPNVSPSKRRNMPLEYTPQRPRDSHPYRRPQQARSASVALSDEEEFFQMRRGGKVTTQRTPATYARRPSEKNQEPRSRATVDPQMDRSSPSLPPNQECNPQTTAAPVTYSIPPAPPPAPADPRTAYNGMRMEQLRILAKLYPGHTPTAAEKAELAKEDGDEAKKK